MKKILFVTYGGGHSVIIDLICRELLKEKEIEFNILALTTAYGALKDKYPLGVVKKLSDYAFLFDDAIASILQYGLMLNDENYTPDVGILKFDSIFYLGLSFHDLVESWGLRTAKSKYKKQKRQAFLPVKSMEKILKYEDPGIIFATSSPRIEHAALIAGNNLGIKSVQILDHFAETCFSTAAKHIVVMNQGVEDSLRSRGLVDRKYYQFGQPAFDESINNVNRINKSEAIKKAGILEEKRVVLYASQKPIERDHELKTVRYIDYEEYNEKIFSILDQVSRESGAKILVRIHPNEKFSDYEKWFLKYPQIFYSNKVLNLFESMAISDFVVTSYSTVGVEALVCGKTVFTFKNDWDKGFFGSFMNEPFIFSNGFKALQENLLKYINNQECRPETNNFFHFGATEKIVGLLKGLLWT